MDFQLISAFVFFVLMGIFLVIKRKNIHIQKIFFPLLYFSMYRTSFGLKAMDSFAKRFRKLLHFLSYVSIGIGFLGMIVIVVSLVHNLWKIITVPEAAAGVALVLPFKVKGGFYVPFFYWIISIFIIALVHEFSHGIYARYHGMKIKSSGFAFLHILIPVLPAAFVEPDEKQLRKASRKKQLDVFSAGPFSNILLAFVVLGIFLLLIGPVSSSIADKTGVGITGFIEEGDGYYPAEKAGMQAGEVITRVDDWEILSIEDFIDKMNGSKPGDTINIVTEENSYEIELAPHPENESRAMLGVLVNQDIGINESFFGGKYIGLFILWFMGLLYWLWVLNLGIGLFNLAPLGPIDGGRMLLVTLEKYMPKKRAYTIWKNVSFVFLLLIVVNILAAFF